MAELVESEPVYSLLPWKNNSKFSRDFVIALGFRKGKQESKVRQILSVIQFLPGFKTYYEGVTTLIFLYLKHRLMSKQALAGVVLEWSYTDLSVLDIQLFGQASAESCAGKSD